jgi:hypothetical protein
VETQSWIIFQILIDIIMAVLLLWFIRFHFKTRGTGSHTETAFKKAEEILTEMGQISQGLEKNLDEKKLLSQNILEQLDKGLKKAEERYNLIEQSIKNLDKSKTDQSGHVINDKKHIQKSINELIGKGYSEKEISRILGIPAGEIELLIKFQEKPKNREYRPKQVLQK